MADKLINAVNLDVLKGGLVLSVSFADCDLKCLGKVLHRIGGFIRSLKGFNAGTASDFISVETRESNASLMILPRGRAVLESELGARLPAYSWASV